MASVPTQCSALLLPQLPTPRMSAGPCCSRTAPGSMGPVPDTVQLVVALLHWASGWGWGSRRSLTCSQSPGPSAHCPPQALCFCPPNSHVWGSANALPSTDSAIPLFLTWLVRLVLWKSNSQIVVFKLHHPGAWKCEFLGRSQSLTQNLCGAGTRILHHSSSGLF